MMTHSEKGLKTLEAMKTTPENWGLTPIKFETKIIPCEVWTPCETCGGGGQIGTLKGKTVSSCDAWNSCNDAARASIRVCPTCPQVKFTRKGRTYFADYQSKGRFTDYDGHHGAASSNNYAFMNGLVLKVVPIERQIATVLWAKGTQFDSRFDRHADQCALCAKTIPSQRFVPVNGQSADGVVHGMWIGEDCARKFFGIKAFKPEQIITRA